MNKESREDPEPRERAFSKTDLKPKERAAYDQALAALLDNQDKIALISRIEISSDDHRDQQEAAIMTYLIQCLVLYFQVNERTTG